MEGWFSMPLITRVQAFDKSVLFPEFVEEGDLKFISIECVKRLNLEVSAMNGSMVIDTLTNGSVTT